MVLRHMNARKKTQLAVIIGFIILVAIVTIIGLRKNIFRADIDTAETNLISNPSFEEGSTGWILSTATNPDGSAKWQIVDDAAHSGTKSLLLNNTDSTAPTTQAKQNLSLIPGASYELSAWFKTENFIGSYIVAKIEWSGQNGASTAGTYATETWKLVKGKEARFVFPSNATKPVLYLWAAKGSTGKVWFDDLSLTSPVFFQSLIRYPTYRNTLYPNQEKKITVGIATDKTHFYPSNDFNVAITIYDASQKVIHQLEQPYSYAAKWDSIDFDLANAPPGNYEVLTRLIARPNTELKRETLPFTISPADAKIPKVYTDQYNRTVVDGKLYFPLGFYSSDDIREVMPVLDRLQDSKFDVLMNYRSNGFTPAEGQQYLDEAQKRNLKIIYPVRLCYYGTKQYLYNDTTKVGPWTGPLEILKGIITTFKDHPAILGWYTNDELDIGYMDQLQTNYDYIKSTDYNHPAWQSVCCNQNFANHLSNTDTIGQTAYPVWTIQGKSTPPAMQDVGYYTRQMRDATMNARSLWMVPEAKVGSQEGVRAVTPEEMLNSAYQMIIGGARGLMFFNLNYVLADPNAEILWQQMKQVGEQIDAIKSIALGIDAPSDKSLTSSQSKVSVLTRLVDNDIYALAVNPYNETISTNFTIGTGLTVTDVTVGLPGRSDRTIAVNNSTFTDQFEPLATRVYKLNIAGQPQPTPTATLIPTPTPTPTLMPTTIPSSAGRTPASTPTPTIGPVQITPTPAPSSSPSAKISPAATTPTATTTTTTTKRGTTATLDKLRNVWNKLKNVLKPRTKGFSEPKWNQNSPVRIPKFNYNARGIDNANLNGEFVILRNDSQGTVNLLGWRLGNARGQEYLLPDYLLNPGQSVWLHTGQKWQYQIKHLKFWQPSATPVTISGNHIYMGQAQEFWNNYHDTLLLYNSQNQLIYMRSY